jgi:hypothetical protein
LDFGQQALALWQAFGPAPRQIVSVERRHNRLRHAFGNAGSRIHFRTVARPMPVSRMIAEARRPAACRRLTS